MGGDIKSASGQGAPFDLKFLICNISAFGRQACMHAGWNMGKFAIMAWTKLDRENFCRQETQSWLSLYIFYQCLVHVLFYWSLENSLKTMNTLENQWTQFLKKTVKRYRLSLLGRRCQKVAESLVKVETIKCTVVSFCSLIGRPCVWNSCVYPPWLLEYFGG